MAARHALWDGIRAFHTEGGTVLLTSHYLEEIEQLAQRVVVIGNGRVLADGDLAQVRGLVAVNRVTLRSPGLPDLPGVTRCERDGDRYELHTPDADQLIRDLVRSDAPFAELHVAPASLEEAFLALTSLPTRPPGDLGSPHHHRPQLAGTEVPR